MHGVVDYTDALWIVSEWMEHGSLQEYLRKHRNDHRLNRLHLVRPHVRYI